MNTKQGEASGQPRGSLFRYFVGSVIVLVVWVPGIVALAMLLTGNAG